MNWRNLFRRKESLARTVTTMSQIGQPQSTPENYENYAKVGYARNVTVYRCVSMISGAARGLTFTLYDKSNAKKPKEIEKHPILELWRKPNPLQSSADLIENLVAFYALDGNSYLEANRGASKTSLPLELWNARPDKMKIIPGPKGYPAAYVFESGGVRREWPVDVVNMKADIMHWKTFHPLNDWYGMSPMSAAMLAIDQNLSGQRYNLALMQNSATPSGVLQVKVTDSNPRGEITEEQYRRMREDFEQNYQGTRNTGKPMIIEGGLTWTQMSFSPKDLGYKDGKALTDQDIALVFGVPGELIGVGEKTFNNYREARLAFYEETVLPIMDGAMGALNRWLTPAFGENLYLDYDRDDIEVLQWKREQKYTSLGAVNFLTQNEKREAVGYAPLPDWENVFVIGNQVGASPEDFSGGGGEQVDDSLNPDGSENPDAEENEDDDDGGGDDKPSKPKKPEGDDDESDRDSEDEKGWKSLNLLNANEKRSSWRAQNARRKRLTGAFTRDLEGDYKELARDLKKVKGHPQDARLTEFALLKVLNEFMPTMEKTLKRHIRYTLEDFGGQVLGEGKSLGYDREHKANLKFDDFVKRYTEKRSGQAISAITSATSKQIRRIVGEWVQTAIVDGDSNAELSKFIESEFEELTPAQATRIARTEVSVASNNGALEAVKSLQIPNMFKEWVTANDDRVRSGENGGADHSVMNGAEVGLDEKFGVPPDSLMDGPGDDSASADQIINCFHPDTLITGYAIAGSRFKYVGRMFKVKTESGRVFSVTENHPVLTSQGFIPVRNISKGDYLLSQCAQIDTVFRMGDVNKNNKPARVEDVFHSIHKLGHSGGLQLATNHFYGDSKFGQSDIDVVFSDSELLDRFKLAQTRGNFILEKKNPMLTDLNSSSGSNKNRIGDLRASSSDPCFFQLPFDKRGVELNARPFNGFLLGLTSQTDAVLSEISRHYPSITSDEFAQFENRFPGVVKGDKVVAVEVLDYSGHVYDLQSNSGLLIADGVVMSNCRCVLTYRSKN